MRIEQKAVSGSAQFSFQHSKIYINLVGKYFAKTRRTLKIKISCLHPSKSATYKAGELVRLQYWQSNKSSIAVNNVRNVLTTIKLNEAHEVA